MSIADKITQLAEIKSSIKTAINGKGQSVGDNMTEYAAAIGNITSAPLYFEGDIISGTTETTSPTFDVGSSDKNVRYNLIGFVNAGGTKKFILKGSNDGETWDNAASLTVTGSATLEENHIKTKRGTVTGYRYYCIYKPASATSCVDVAYCLFTI